MDQFIYEQYLRRKADTDSQQQLSSLGGLGDYGAQSMPNSANKYNNDRQEDYLNAMGGGKRAKTP